MDAETVKWFDLNAIPQWKLTEHPDGSVDVGGDVRISYVGNSSPFPVKFRYISGNFVMHSGTRPHITSLIKFPDKVEGLLDIGVLTKLTSMKYFPRFTGDSYIPRLEVPAIEYRYLLLCTLKGEPLIDGSAMENSAEYDIEKIIVDGRIDGVMPSELIPGKIKQLRELK